VSFFIEATRPNGDPDAGNLPRVDVETGHGLLTDVCLKRKVRNFVTLTKNLQSPFGIYVAEAAVLGRAHFNAFKKLGINLGEDSKTELSEEVAERMREAGLAEGLRVEEDEEEKQWLILEGTADKKAIKEWLKTCELSKANKGLVSGLLKNAKGRKPTRDESLSGRAQMCRDFFDVRTFGAVMSLKSAPNCGQVRGPVQLSFSRSIDPIVSSEHAITRMAVATEKESEQQSGDNRTMGRKFTIPYALYRTHGFINPFLADQTGFGDEDLQLFFAALENAFQFDVSAARPAGSMSPRALLVFKHESQLGKVPSHSLFERLKVADFERQPSADGKPPREFADYASRVTFDGIPLNAFIKPGESKDLGNGITLIRRI
jgi:CRISPR-associated protein Csd2